MCQNSLFCGKNPKASKQFLSKTRPCTDAREYFIIIIFIIIIFIIIIIIIIIICLFLLVLIIIICLAEDVKELLYRPYSSPWILW